jgi:hypothetical protein
MVLMSRIFPCETKAGVEKTIKQTVSEIRKAKAPVDTRDLMV